MAYVYRHIRVDKNEPFYIGICKGDDGHKRAFRNTGRHRHWQNIVKKTDYEVEILMDNLSEDDAIKSEMYFIKLYGRTDLGTGSLCNKTNGGDGGLNPGPETRKKQSESHKGYKHRPESIEKMKIAQKDKVISKETREKMAAKLRGRPQPEWQRKILSKAAMGKKVSWCYKAVYQFDLNGDYITEYESISAASKKLGLKASNIQKVISGKRSLCGGFIFRYKKDNFEEIKKEVSLICKSIKKRDNPVVNTNTGIVYKSTRDAAKKENIEYWKLNRYFGKREFSHFKLMK